eukprot:4662618-Pyramimonas_sp.AAC.1
MIRGGIRIAIARAIPPRPRCKHTACCCGVIRALVKFSHACLSRVNSKNDTFPEWSQHGPLAYYGLSHCGCRCM